MRGRASVEVVGGVCRARLWHMWVFGILMVAVDPRRDGCLGANLY